MARIIFIDNTAHHLFGQQHLFTAFIAARYEIILICPNDNNYFVKLQKLGYNCQDIAIDGKGINPFQDYKLIKMLKLIFAKLKPDLIISFTIKPNLYAAIAARKYGIPIIPSITGLGYVFTVNAEENHNLMANLLQYIRPNYWLRKIVIILYKFAFKQVAYIFFQNDDDKNILQAFDIFSPNCKLCVLPGDGVDLTKFTYVGYTQRNSERTKFLYSGRLLWDKGLGELIAAMRIVKSQYPLASLTIIGNYFTGNPSSINAEEVAKWQNDGLCEYLGMVDNVAEIVSEHDCVVLPSYREGMPRALLEASSMGKPIITVNSVGCKDVVVPDVTGLMCNVKDIDSLAQSMLKFISLDFVTKQQMGINGRKFMQDRFDQNIVVNKYLQSAKELVTT